jgi:hypothetical protein
LLQEGRDTLGCAKVCGNPADIGILDKLPKVLKSRRYSSFGAPVNNDVRTFRGERGGNGKANARSRAGDDGTFAFESKVHLVAPL